MEEEKTFEPANADSDQTDSDDEVIEVVNVGGRIFYPNDEPEELYYMAWAAKFSHVETQNWVGGHPLMPSSVEWPQCQCHGPLKFCWQFDENVYTNDDADDKSNGTLILCFMCVTTDSSGWIWPNKRCITQRNYYDMCHVRGYSFCYRFIRVSKTADLKLRYSEEADKPFMPLRYLKMEPVKLVRPEYEFEEHDSYHLVGNSYVSHDSFIVQSRTLEYDAFNNSAFLFETRGIKDQEDLRAGHGYIAMNEKGDLFPFWSAPNPGVFNVSKGLSMTHTF